MHQGVFLSNEDLDRNQEEWSDDDQEGDNDETRMEGEYFFIERDLIEWITTMKHILFSLLNHI